MKTQTPQPPATGQAKSTAENVKDTLESIVVAFILAFVFRAFIVEAFVIPTGSMAVTLYGNNLTNTCSTCGYEYARGIDPQDRSGIIPLRCPNCDTTPDKLYAAQIAAPDSGDRILVHKWPFDVGAKWLGPQRWEVTVFKDPTDGTTNFIKRLVGLPGEVLEIIDGDIYTASLEPTKDHPGLNKVAPGLVERLDQLRLDIYKWGQEAMYVRGDNGRQFNVEFGPRYAAINKELLPYLRIHRKVFESPRAQESLWFNVFNQDFLPRYDKMTGVEDLPRGSERVGWYAEGAAAAKAWGVVEAQPIAQRELTFDAKGEATHFIRFAGKQIGDFSAYNPGYASDPVLVGDVRVRFTWFPDDGQGAIVMQMNRKEATFIAEIRADGSAQVIHKQPGLTGGQQLIGQRDKIFEPGQTLEVEFMNVDYVVRLVINGRPVIESTAKQYAPDIARSLAKHHDGGQDVKPTEVRIGAKAMRCRIRHVVLDRDVYYRDARLQEDQKYADPPLNTQFKYNPYYQWPGWATAGMPILLRDERWVNGRKMAGEYLMLGDNSAASKDSRLWWEIGPHLTDRASEYQVGTVPGDQLIGEAFFVYWPAGYRCPSLRMIPFPLIRNLGDVGFIPNIGRMRWIR